MRTIIGVMTLSVGLAMGCAPLSLPNLGGPRVTGSGTVKEETREVPDFTGVDIGSSFQAEVMIGPKAPIRISADDNLLPLVTTEVKNGRLIVGFKDNTTIDTKNPLKVTITTPKLDFLGASGAADVTAKVAASESFEIEASGASQANVSGIETSKLVVKASGASRMTMAGRAKSAKVELSGASQIHSKELTTEELHADLSGASHGDVQATASVRADLSGASSLNVAGNPPKQAVETSGASSISFK